MIMFAKSNIDIEFPLGLFILNNLKVSFLSRSFDRFIISFWIGISIIALIQLFLSGWFVLTFWFPLAFSLLSLSLIQNRPINSELKIWWKNFFLKKSIFWGGILLLFSSAFYMVSSPGCLPTCLFSLHRRIFAFSISFSMNLASAVGHKADDPNHRSTPRPPPLARRKCPVWDQIDW